ncbi:hypothetical protein LX32DRAFT_305426 [Colletotrichum zoysiae]|uniref:Uncharacterized protein n=1 Tax=Colletotrichum zoysiae TaxID=1216348 RepID=A0AAD9M539_9PEZI|nr:hypothetical protein LX32DRAFT_305426 [Colletotrichum zoysiae]
MQNFPAIRHGEAGRSEVGDLESLTFSDSTAFELEPQSGQATEFKPSESQELRADDEVRPDHHDGARLLDDTNSTRSDKNATPNQSKWKAIGVLGLCILGLGSILVVGAVAFLSYFWQMSIRERDGEVAHSQLWSRTVFSNWASRVVTITAALLRLCLALQMGVFTGMIASLMIERAGVPLHSAPLISMLRATTSSRRL